MLAGISMGWVIAGVGAVALPLIAHLLSRRGGRTIVFPAVRFVMRAAAEHARRHRLRDLLLFLMRAAAVLLIALAFDRPVWITDAEGRTPGGDGRDVVIVLDASASMGRSERGRTLYEVARDRGVEALDGLDWSRDRAGVVFVRASAEAALPRLSGNRGALIERVRESEPTLERGDLGAALALARDMPRALDSDDSSPRERRILVIGDRQRTQWEGGEAPVGVGVEFFPVGPEGATPNLAVTDLFASPVRPIAGREFVVTATVLNAGPTARAPRVVLRDAGGRSLGAATPTIGPGASATLTFSVVFDEPGTRRVEAALVDESFTIDDIGRTVVEVLESRRVAMVTRASPRDRSSAAYFLEAAIAPAPGGIYGVERVHPDTMNARTLDGVGAAIVVEAGSIPALGVEALRRFGEFGGGVLWVADSPASGDALRAVGREAPLFESVGALMDVPGGAAMTDLRFADMGGATGPGSAEVLAGPLELSLLSARFASIMPVRVHEGARVLARLETGDPFIVAAPFGQERRIAVLGAIDPARSTLVKSPAFPVLVGELVGSLVERRTGNGVANVGEALTIPIGGSAQGVLKDDRGRAARIVDEGPEGTRVAVDPVGEACFVDVVNDAGEVLGVGAARIDGRESDMSVLDDAQINAILTGALEGLGARGGAGSLIGQRRPVELWGWIMAGAVLLLVGESLVAAARTGARAVDRRARGER